MATASPEAPALELSTPPPPAPPANGSQGASIFDTTLCLLLNRGTLGNSRKAKGAVQSLVAVTVAASADMVSLNKKLFKAPEYKAIKTIDGAFGEYLSKVSLPSLFKGGSFAIPIALVEQVDNRVKQYIAERSAAVNVLKSAWPRIVEESETELGAQLFDVRNYPSAERVSEKFYIEYKWVDYGVPGRLQAIKASIWKEEREKAEASLQNAKDAAVEDVRGRMLDLVSHMLERLTPGEDGKKKVFRDSLVDNVKEFLDIFPVLNTAAGDSASTPLVEKARAVLNGVDPKLLRDDELVRRNVAEQFAEIKASLDTMVTTKTRKIVLADDVDDERGVA